MPLACSIPARFSLISASFALISSSLRSFAGSGDVDVEPVRPDHVAVIVEDLVPDDDDVVHTAPGVDDPMARAESLARMDYLIDGGRDVSPVVGMLV